MATVAVADFIIGDLLTDLKLKPWWETWRGYCFSITVAAALAVNYFLQTGIILTCLPRDNSTDVLDGYTTTTANFVNNYCFSQTAGLPLFIGYLTITYCGLVFVFSSWWLHIPGVIEAFESYVSIRRTIEELNMTDEQLKTLSISQRNHTGENDELLKVRKACSKLWNYKAVTERVELPIWQIVLVFVCACHCPRGAVSLRNLYNLRNVLLITIILGTVMYGIIGRLYNTISEEMILPCNISSDEVEVVQIREYECVQKLPSLIPQLWSIFVGACDAQVILLLIGFYNTLKQLQHASSHISKSKTRVGKGNEWLFDLINFNNIFWEYSRSNDSGLFNTFCHFIQSQGEGRLKEQFLQKPESTDLYLIKTFTNLSSDWKIIAGMIHQQITKREFKCESDEYKTLVEIVKEIPELEWCKEVKVLLDYVYKLKYFELFVALLSITSSEENEQRINTYLSSLKLNLDAIGQPYQNGASLLYYAMRTNDIAMSSLKAKDRILQACPTDLSLFWHYSGISYNHRRGNTSTANHNDLTEMINNVQRPLSDLAQDISHFKFMTWSTEINEFAQNICQQKKWEVLVALMNAFIIDEDLVKDETTDKVIPGCNLDLFEAVNPTREAEDSELPNSLLYFAFTKRDYAPFTLTAAATILHQTKGLEKKVQSKLDSDIFYEDPIDFVMRHSNVPLHQKLELQSLVEAAAQVPPPQESGETPKALEEVEELSFSTQETPLLEESMA